MLTPPLNPSLNNDSARLPHLSLTLASASPARLATLRAAGIDAAVRVSNVDEDMVRAHTIGSPAQIVMALAAEKARRVATQIEDNQRSSSPDPSVPSTDLVLGCDSMFEFDGDVFGKPHSPEVARERLHQMAGHSGVLHTGHCLIATASNTSIAGISHARVTIAPMTDAEIDAYVDSGEPLHVAGSFTVDGLGGAFVPSIDGDYHGVVGLSLPLFRDLLAARGLSITQLWTHAHPAVGTLPPIAQRFLSSAMHFSAHHGADGFILSENETHWGMGGAGGICAFRRSHTTSGIEILAQLRGLRTHGGGTWSIPGGAREWNETLEEGALREFEEETQISADHLHIIDSVPNVHEDWEYQTYIAECDPDLEPHPDHESERLGWIDIDAVDGLPEGLHHGFAATWPMIKEKIEACAAR
ncbi:MAG: Maf family nucleotide pyrophosphatase [Actinomycetaceae bacterium]|nr:Maf family nucleotide pyrophosphatase [Actinomycetaceae bacterium]MDY6083610.1 Maf family nucleotide pyrophosphatase [Actinomycetaceae bacterium]